ncbi:hypothetical protein SBOR_9312 [Sclerotinia borealis F-4128]|uniref:Mitochondrial ATPase complex subunit ATP10 n=1 Tax=Sclerotinia borealis (strain F-4128) TaxID=1432307 RepID=W9C0J6_SCLBF|nr:hypothetical protein SBOR_9312 [Sclerotinia borealis F-4128]
MFLTRLPIRSARKQLNASACLLCQWRSFTTTYPRLNEKKETPPPPAPAAPSVLDEAPRASGKRVESFTPKPLDRAIGLPDPPRAGENSGVDPRTYKQRKDDFVTWEKHLEKRKRLTAAISKPYFREWGNMKYHKGKTFLAPPRIFKSDRALYFPNLSGRTLEPDSTLYENTTPILEGKISVVSVYSGAWAEHQAATFASEKSNPGLHEVVRNSKGLAQTVHINVEENYLKAMLIKFFRSSLRKKLPELMWKRYFVVQKGLTDEIKDAIGMLNSKVGYTYILDGECKIRWAGSGPAEEYEVDVLAKNVSRLLEDAKAPLNEKRLAQSAQQSWDSAAKKWSKEDAAKAGRRA